VWWDAVSSATAWMRIVPPAGGAEKVHWEGVGRIALGTPSTEISTVRVPTSSAAPAPNWAGGKLYTPGPPPATRRVAMGGASAWTATLTGPAGSDGPTSS